ncbi:hypothetical protein [Atopobacter phocae]|uniref:hypothetical protein n=1 Tax=Atopobacter phocae TaxID=136492 RepID=UPI00046E5E55|nr:hypothetical protein [Atopobacter phocae]
MVGIQTFFIVAIPWIIITISFILNRTIAKQVITKNQIRTLLFFVLLFVNNELSFRMTHHFQLGELFLILGVLGFAMLLRRHLSQRKIYAKPFIKRYISWSTLILFGFYFYWCYQYVMLWIGE